MSKFLKILESLNENGSQGVPLNKKGNTKIVTSGDTTSLIYYGFTLAKFNSNTITLYADDSYNSVSNRDRMNQFSNENDLGFSVFQKKGEQYYTFKNETKPFDKNITLQR